MSFNLSTFLPGLFGVLGSIGSTALGGKLAVYETAAQTAVKAAVTKADNGIDDLQSAFAKFETANPLVQEALTGTTTILSGLGIKLPSEELVVTHVKAAIADLSGIFVPASTVDATTTPVAAASAGATDNQTATSGTAVAATPAA